MTPSDSPMFLSQLQGGRVCPGCDKLIFLCFTDERYYCYNCDTEWDGKELRPFVRSRRP